MKTIFQSVFRTLYPQQSPGAIKRQYGLPDTLNLTVRFEDGWFVVTSPELPGLVTEARSHKELIEMVNDAVLTYFDVPRREADIVYDQFTLGDQVVQYRGQLQTKLT